MCSVVYLCASVYREVQSEDRETNTKNKCTYLYMRVHTYVPVYTDIDVQKGKT